MHSYIPLGPVKPLHSQEHERESKQRREEN